MCFNVKARVFPFMTEIKERMDDKSPHQIFCSLPFPWERALYTQVEEIDIPSSHSWASAVKWILWRIQQQLPGMILMIVMAKFKAEGLFNMCAFSIATNRIAPENSMYTIEIFVWPMPCSLQGFSVQMVAHTVMSICCASKAFCRLRQSCQGVRNCKYTFLSSNVAWWEYGQNKHLKGIMSLISIIWLHKNVCQFRNEFGMIAECPRLSSFFLHNAQNHSGRAAHHWTNSQYGNVTVAILVSCRWVTEYCLVLLYAHAWCRP